ncbi:MAG TPA: ABC transporter ATP-binding protein [Terriglobia bacterium]|nr:ABC transporter ATP-binding protein [Terriglobia bacterium]
MLEVRSLTKRYSSIPVVQRVSFVIRPGGILGYLGPNGAGKSTTVKMLTGLVEPSQGQIFFNGRDIREDVVDYKRHLGYVPEDPQVYPYLTGWEYLQLVGRLRSIPSKALEEKMQELMKLFSLQNSRHSALSSYSKGMRQKILIVAALLHNPDLLIFDEPLSGLDVTTALIFRNLVSSLAAKGKMILYSSHVLEVVEKICSEVVILQKGSIVAYDSVERLRELMRLSSLEDVFAQLVLQEDTESIANEIIEVMGL